MHQAGEKDKNIKICGKFKVVFLQPDTEMSWGIIFSIFVFVKI